MSDIDRLIQHLKSIYNKTEGSHSTIDKEETQSVIRNILNEIITIGIPAVHEIIVEVKRTKQVFTNKSLHVEYKRSNDFYRADLIKLLTRIGGEEAARYLIYEFEHSKNDAERYHENIKPLIDLEDPKTLDLRLNLMLSVFISMNKYAIDNESIYIAIVEFLGDNKYIKAIDNLVLDYQIYFQKPQSLKTLSLVSTLAKFDDPKVILPLISFLEQPYPTANAIEKYSSISNALSTIGSSSVESLLGLITHRQKEVRDCVEKTLLKIGEPAVMALLPKLLDDDWRIRRAVAGILGNVKNKLAVEALAESAQHDVNPNVRRAAVWALGEIGGSKARQIIRIALNDEDQKVCRTANGALEKADLFFVILGKSLLEMLLAIYLFIAEGIVFIISELYLIIKSILKNIRFNIINRKALYLAKKPYTDKILYQYFSTQYLPKGIDKEELNSMMPLHAPCPNCGVLIQNPGYWNHYFGVCPECPEKLVFAKESLIKAQGKLLRRELRWNRKLRIDFLKTYYYE